MSTSCTVCHGTKTTLFTQKNNHDIFRCAECALMFVDPIPNSASEVYDASYFSGAEGGFGYVNYDEDKEPMIPVFQKYLAIIKKAAGKTGSLLDVGAATGFFVRLANNAGFTARGIEISEHAASLGRKNGLDVQTGTLADVHGTYDVITMLDVIEHVPNPCAEIKRVHTLLNPGGILILNTPDAGSLFARVLGKRWHLIVPPEHLYYFNRPNLTRLLEEEGFVVDIVTTIGKNFTLKYIFKTLYKWTKLRVFEVYARWFGKGALARLAVPLNLHDNMFILARKK